MIIWLIAAVLFASWIVGVLFFGKGGFIHILLLCAVSTGLVQFVHDRLAARRGGARAGEAEAEGRR